MKKRVGLWWRPDYTAWFAADTATAIGVAVRSLAISLVGYAVSGSTVAAGWLGSASMIAQQVFGIFGGTYVDRHDRRTLIIVNAVVSMLCWGSVAGLLLTGGLRYSVLLAIAVVSSAVNGFLGSATDAMLKSIIDMRDYPKARSLNEGRDATVNMAGSPVGGFLYGVRPWLPFLITACMYAVAGVTAAGIRESHKHDATVRPEAGTAAPDVSADGGSRSFFKDFREGWSWSLHRTMLVMTMIVSALLNFGINGVQYGIQLHLVSAGMNGAYIGFINTGIFCAMLSAASEFMLVFVPVFAGVIAAMGKAAAASAANTVILAAAQFFSQISVNFLTPVCGTVMGLSVTGAVHPEMSTDKLGELIRKAAVWGLSLLMTVFMSVLSAQTFVTNSADNVLIRTAKFAVSSGVPIVGGTISDAVNTVHASLSLMHSSIGTYGIAAGIVILLPSLISVMCYRFALTAAEAVSEVFGVKELSTLFRACGAVMSIIMAVIVCFLLLNTISAVIMLAAGSIQA